MNCDVDSLVNYSLLDDNQGICTKSHNPQDDSVFIQFSDSDGLELGSPIWIPLSVNVSKLSTLLKDVLNQVCFECLL